MYLLKSVIWATGFALVYHLFLRNERFFGLNRFFLLAGIVVSFIFPFISVHYTVILPVISTLTAETGASITGSPAVSGNFHIIQAGLLILYLSGTLAVFLLVLWQGKKIWQSIRRSDIIRQQQAKIIQTTEYESAFSFFSYVFVNPSLNELEAKEIMNHEMVHINQKHWIDLVLGQMLCILQWFNPVAWIYFRYIRQNHEFLADEVAMQRSSDPAIYRAALLNQIAGASVVSLVNSFGYSLNKKRFFMMKNTIKSPYRKMRILFILPVFACILYSFAKPEYKYKLPDQNSGNTGTATIQVQHEVTGTVVQKDGQPLPGTNITLQSTTIGTITDQNGSFKLVNVPDDGVLVASFVGFKSKVIKANFKAPLKIVLERDTVKYSGLNTGTMPTPPPPPFFDPQLNIDGQKPLYVVDGEIKTPEEVAKLNQSDIESISVWKKDTVEKYGEKGKNGVVDIKLKNAGNGSSTQLPGVPPPPPPPPPASGSGVGQGTGEKPLVVIDGKISDVDMNKIDPETILSMNVLRDKSPSEKPATGKYGEKGKNGVIEITTKEYAGKVLVVINGAISDRTTLDKINVNDIKSMNVLKDESAVKKYGDKGKYGVMEVITYKEGEKRPDIKVEEQVNVDVPFVVVEEMPQFPGGNEALSAWIVSNLKYPAEAVKGKIQGKVHVSFMVSKMGKIKNVAVIKSVNPALDAEAIRVVGSMPDWKPGKQGGKGVDVQMEVPVEFRLNN